MTTEPTLSTGLRKEEWRQIAPSPPTGSSTRSLPSTTRSKPLSRLQPIPTKDRKTLIFDIETRKVGFHTGGRFAPDGCEPIAIAWSWLGSDDVECWQLGKWPVRVLLEQFRLAYDEADVLVGHYIRKFDLVVLNGSMLEHRLPPLSAKLVVDTHDIHRAGGISKSQENLAELFDLSEAKYHMNDARWREATRLTKEGMQETRRRVVDDVLQSKKLYEALREHGWLRPPKLWRP